jgi:hypothetical protein
MVKKETFDDLNNASKLKQAKDKVLMAKKDKITNELIEFINISIMNLERQKEILEKHIQVFKGEIKMLESGELDMADEQWKLEVFNMRMAKKGVKPLTPLYNKAMVKFYNENN